MSTISHEIRLQHYTIKVKQHLKIICQDWTRIDDDLYVIHHTEELQKECLICNEISQP